MNTNSSFSRKADKSRIFFYISIVAATIVISFAFGIYSRNVKNLPYRFFSKIYSDIMTAYEETEIFLTKHPKHYLYPTRTGGNGVTINKIADQGELIFIAGFFKDYYEIRLLRPDGEIVNRWVIKFSEIFPDTSELPNPAATDWNSSVDGALALPDGSVVFNLENGGLVKLDRCGNIVWTLISSSHHSVELSEKGGFWVPGRNFYTSEQVSPAPPFPTPLEEDTILRVSDDGSLISTTSVPGLFYENGLESLLTSTGETFAFGTSWDEELVHLNKIAELKSDIADDFPLFEAGDLLLSLRQYNLIFVVDPDTWIIKWWKIGPWIRQHDPEFIPGGKIIVFNNNCYRKIYEEYPAIAEIPKLSNIIEHDPVTDTSRIILGNKDNQKFLSVIRGVQEFSPLDGSLFVAEYEGGRVIGTNKEGQVVWEYINRYDDDEVAEITEIHAYPKDYFNMTDWSCENNQAGN
jgi:hypothetical protein